MAIRADFPEKWRFNSHAKDEARRILNAKNGAPRLTFKIQKAQNYRASKPPYIPIAPPGDMPTGRANSRNRRHALQKYQQGVPHAASRQRVARKMATSFRRASYAAPWASSRTGWSLATVVAGFTPVAGVVATGAAGVSGSGVSSKDGGSGVGSASAAVS